MSKKGLGRGLGALISEQADDQPGIRDIRLSEIEPNPDQPRREFNQSSLQELAESIKLHGLLQPILVKPRGDKYSIIAGERRFRAAQLAGLDHIACIIQDCTEQEIAERAIVENIQRADLPPVDEGLAYKRLMQEYGLTQEQIAQRVGKGRATVANLLRVILLPEPVLELLREEKISLGHAKIFSSLDSSLQVLLAQKVAKDGLSVRETEDVLKKLTEKSESERKGRKIAKEQEPGLGNIEERLRYHFQTKVKVKGEPSRGKIEIEYFSEEELNRLLELWKVIIE